MGKNSFNFFLFFLWMIASDLFAQNNNIQNDNIRKIDFIKTQKGAVLHLPYSPKEDTKLIFVDNPPLAIKIIGVFVNGIKISYSKEVVNVNPETHFIIGDVSSQKEECIISMNWKMQGSEFIYWHDGRGIIFEQVESFLFTPRINIYELKKGMENILITYKIVLPFPEITLEDLYKENIEEKYYTQEYIISIDLRQIFEETQK